MRLLLSKPDSLGDQFILAGIVQALRRLHPDWRIVWHMRPGMEVIAPVVGAEVFTPQTLNPPEVEAARLNNHPASLIVLPYPLSPFEAWSEDIRRRVAWWGAFLRATKWDTTALPLVNRNWVGDFTVAVAPAATRIGFQANAARQLLVNEAQAVAGVDAPSFTQTLVPSFTRSETDQLRDLLALVEPALAHEPVLWRAQIPWRRPATQSPRILIAPGVGADPRRAWGVKKLMAVADDFRTRGATVTWLEGPDDASHLTDLPANSTHPRVKIGREDLPLLFKQLSEVDLLICHDTAYVHIAAGIGVPTVAIFGAGQDRRFHPTGGKVKVVTSQIACAGCQWHCLWDRLLCVSEISVATVTKAAVEMLAGNASLVVESLATPLKNAPEGEMVALRSRLQQEILTLNADRFARLQIIQSLVSQQQAKPPTVPPASSRVSVIVPMGRPERVAPTLASVASQQSQFADWQVVLVGVAAAEVAQTHPHLPIVPVRLAKNQLPPRTRCLGVEHATGDWYLFVDDDVELSPNCFARIQQLLAEPEYAANAARPVGAVGFRLPGKSGRFFEGLTDISNFWAQQGTMPEDRDWLYSAAFLVRAKAYHDSGGFNPDLPNGEDVDLTRRIAGAGYRLRYEPTLVARHDHRRDTLTSMWRYFWRNGNAARYFFAGHGGACPFSVKTVWLKSWSDLRMNLNFQRERQSGLGWRAPFVWLNYLIVEASLEWHWQEYLHEEGRYLKFPARARSDATYVRALTAWDDGQQLIGATRYLFAVLQDFMNPVRR